MQQPFQLEKVKRKNAHEGRTTFEAIKLLPSDVGLAVAVLVVVGISGVDVLVVVVEVGTSVLVDCCSSLSSSIMSRKLTPLA